MVQPVQEPSKRKPGNQPAAVPPPRGAPTFRPRVRFLRAVTFFLSVVLHLSFWDIVLSRSLLFRWYVRQTMTARWVKLARRFRKVAVEQGGMQIKFGQFLSSRADVIPDEVRHELAGLQDEVPAAPASHVLDLIMREHGKPPDQLFRCFDHEAVAAASLGQVHFATLHDGRIVAVKVQRPHIEAIIEVDLSALEWVLRLIKDFSVVRRRADVMALFGEFARVLRQELNYVQEARNAEIFRANLGTIPGVYVPMPIKELTTMRVLVMERIGGIKINDKAALLQAGVNFHDLAERLNQTYLKQFFLDGFFHADPHPGNLFVRIEPEMPRPLSASSASTSTATNGVAPPGVEPPPFTTGTPFTLIFIDFGMVGMLPPQTIEAVRSGLLGLATNDAERIVDVFYHLKMFLPNVDRRPIIRAVQILLRHIYNLNIRDLTNIDVETIFDEVRDLVYDLPFQLPQDMLYLGRALGMVTGLIMDLDPDMNLFDSMRPFAGKLLDEERQNGSLIERIQQEIREMGQILLTLPRQMDTYYRAANRGDLQTRTDFGRVERMLRRVEQSTDRLTGGVIATGLFLGGVQLRLRGMQKEASGAWVAAAATILWTIRPRGRGNGGAPPFIKRDW
ncbi:MAG: AarF/ABC1/UbiB kinase family protein [Chloroflexaceae bacterium]|nr:AarF/ABC1/UbiB kinase family protein [Chloroflexaceae bacterium]